MSAEFKTANVDAVIDALKRRAHAYAGEVVKQLASVAGGVLDEHDISRAFVVGFTAGVESADAAHSRARVSYPLKVARRRRR